MPEKRSLYEQVILDHNRNPRNFRKTPDATAWAEGYNPLCGDQFTVYLKLDGDQIREVTFVGSGCAISKSSASLMTAAVEGKTRHEAESLFAGFHRMLTSDPTEESPGEPLGELEAMRGVREYPVRVKCATLPWHTLLAAFDAKTEPASTE